MKKILGCLSIMGAALALASCSNKAHTVEDIKKSGKLVISTEATFAPFESKVGDDFVGIDIDLANEYAKYLGVELVIKDQDFDAALISASTGKVDLAIAGITKNSKREETLGFSDSYYKASQVVIVKNDSIYASITDTDTLLSELTNTKAKIGFQRGTTGEYYVSGDADWGFDGIESTTPVSYDNGAMACKALSNGQIDAVIIDKAPADMFVKNNPDLKVLDPILTEEEYAIACAKGNDDLIKSLNEFIKTIKENGVFDQIISKYYEE